VTMPRAALTPGEGVFPAVAALQFPELLFQLASLTTGRYRPRILEHLKLLTQGANLLERIVARPQVPRQPAVSATSIACKSVAVAGTPRIHADLQLFAFAPHHRQSAGRCIPLVQLQARGGPTGVSCGIAEMG